jgi:AhpD family alkylhydroperoxidase
MKTFEMHTKNSAPEAARPQFDRAEKLFGTVPNLIRTLAASPAAARAYLDLEETLADSGLTPEEQQVAVLAASWQNECGYCMAAESAGARQHGMDPGRLERLRNGEPLEDEKLEALRLFTRAVVDARGQVGSDAVEAFLDAGFESSHVMDVVLAVSKKTLSNYANHIAHTPLDEAFHAFEWEKPELATA